MNEIDVKELRVGNLLKKDGVVVTIDARSIFDIWQKTKDYERIPLIEEWLVKFGFEKTYNSNYRTKYDYPCNFIGYDFSKNDDKSMQGFRYYGHYIKIEFVHQLQNLYFALTGNELTLRQ